ncbi:MAG: DUF2017 family protein [Egibacteraceae bacterium]
MGRLHGVRRLEGDGIRVRLSARERDALRMLPGQILPVLTGDHELGADGSPIRERLFPPAYANDPLADMEFREMVGDGIVQARADAFRTFARTLDQGAARRLVWTIDLDPEEAAAWLSAVNDARLTLAMIVGISSEGEWKRGPDSHDPRSVMLYYLGWLEDELVTALMGGLKDPR